MNILVQATAPGEPLVHFWSNCVAAGRANEGLRAGWQEQLRMTVRECGFRYLRFHGLFHDDMFVYREDAQGRPIYSWQYIDLLFDALLDIGIRPFVELSFSPRAMASQLETTMWWKAHGSPPDLKKWRGLVTEFARHCVSRYGIDEVRQWYFEVWNEPNLHPFFTGTKSQYFELYRVSAEALKSIDPALRVGGPATSNFVADARFAGEEEQPLIGAETLVGNYDEMEWRPVWVEDFLIWCAGRKVPVDFVSTHPYPTDFALDGHGEYLGVSRAREAAVSDLRLLRDIVNNSAYPLAEIHCTEWSSSPGPRDHAHDFPPAAAYVALTNLEGAGLVDSLAYWTFSDVIEEVGGGESIWHGGFGFINLQGIPKPVYHAYRFLNRLGTEMIARGPGYIVTRHASGRLTALLYHYPDEMRKSVPISRTADHAEKVLRTGNPKAVQLTLADLPLRSAFSVETLDEDNGWGRGAWEKMGCPEPPTREQNALLLQAAHPGIDFHTPDSAGALELTITMKPWAVVLIDQHA